MIVVRYADDAVLGFEHWKREEMGNPRLSNFLSFRYICAKTQKGN
jgi:hypothetical protein